MNFAFSEEQEELRKSVRRFLDEKSPITEVRRLMETEAGYDEAVWKLMAEQLGLQGLIIPEAQGGSGYSYVELIVVLEEMGKSLLCAPFFSTVALAANLAMIINDDSCKSALTSIAGGAVATVAFTEANGKWTEDGITATATKSGDGWVINGEKMFVLDGHTANLIGVAARTDKGVSIFGVRGEASGLTKTPLSTMDQTRKQAKLTFASTPGDLLGEEGKGWDLVT